METRKNHPLYILKAKGRFSRCSYSRDLNLSVFDLCLLCYLVGSNSIHRQCNWGDFVTLQGMSVFPLSLYALL